MPLCVKDGLHLEWMGEVTVKLAHFCYFQVFHHIMEVPKTDVRRMAMVKRFCHNHQCANFGVEQEVRSKARHICKYDGRGCGRAVLRSSPSLGSSQWQRLVANEACHGLVSDGIVEAYPAWPRNRHAALQVIRPHGLGRRPGKCSAQAAHTFGPDSTRASFFLDRHQACERDSLETPLRCTPGDSKQTSDETLAVEADPVDRTRVAGIRPFLSDAEVKGALLRQNSSEESSICAAEKNAPRNAMSQTRQIELRGGSWHHMSKASGLLALRKIELSPSMGGAGWYMGLKNKAWTKHAEALETVLKPTLDEVDKKRGLLVAAETDKRREKARGKMQDREKPSRFQKEQRSEPIVTCALKGRDLRLETDVHYFAELEHDNQENQKKTEKEQRMRATQSCAVQRINTQRTMSTWDRYPSSATAQRPNSAMARIMASCPARTSSPNIFNLVTRPSSATQTQRTLSAAESHSVLTNRVAKSPFGDSNPSRRNKEFSSPRRPRTVA